MRPRYWAFPELLGLGCVFFITPGNSGREGAYLLGELPGGLDRYVARSLSSLVVIEIGGVGGLEVVLGISDARVVLEFTPPVEVVPRLS